jgi:hypothetical protein
MFIVMYLQANATVNLCSIVLVLMVLRLLLMFLASLRGCWYYFCIPTFLCCLLPYKNICFTLILEHHKKSGVWLWSLVSDFGIASCWLYLLDFVRNTHCPLTCTLNDVPLVQIARCLPVYQHVTQIKMPVVILYILHCPLTSANELTFIVVRGEQLCMLIA